LFKIILAGRLPVIDFQSFSYLCFPQLAPPLKPTPDPTPRLRLLRQASAPKKSCGGTRMATKKEIACPELDSGSFDLKIKHLQSISSFQMLEQLLFILN